MVGHIDLEAQVGADFSHARRKALFRRIGARLRSDPALGTPPCFGEVSRMLGVRGGIHRGRRVVRSTDIVGSVGRCSDFDKAFMPKKANVESKWKRVDRLFYRAKELPPVSLYKIGGTYFVLDGNHRVSVYRYHGVEWIDAEVTEFRPGLWSGRGDKGNLIEPAEGGPKVREMMDLRIWKQRHEEMIREVEQHRLARALRRSRKQRGASRASSLVWELKRIAGRLLKLLRALRKAG